MFTPTGSKSWPENTFETNMAAILIMDPSLIVHTRKYILWDKDTLQRLNILQDTI